MRFMIDFDPTKDVAVSKYATDFLKEEHYITTKPMSCIVLNDKDFSITVPEGYLFRKWNISKNILSILKNETALIVLSYIKENPSIKCNKTNIYFGDFTIVKAEYDILKHLKIPLLKRLLVCVFLFFNEDKLLEKNYKIAKQAVQFFLREKKGKDGNYL